MLPAFTFIKEQKTSIHINNKSLMKGSNYNVKKNEAFKNS